MDFDKLRDRLVTYLRVEGVTQTHISKQVGDIPLDVLSRFKNGKRHNLYKSHAKSLDKYLKSKNY